MVTFDSFSAYDVEKDLMRFRCYFDEQLILCGVTRAALVVGVSHPISTLAQLVSLYQTRTEAIQRVVLYRLKRRSRSDDSALIIDVNDVYQLGWATGNEEAVAVSK